LGNLEIAKTAELPKSPELNNLLWKKNWGWRETVAEQISHPPTTFGAAGRVGWLT
jgi:hypothetical protein